MRDAGCFPNQGEISYLLSVLCYPYSDVTVQDFPRFVVSVHQPKDVCVIYVWNLSADCAKILGDFSNLAT